MAIRFYDEALANKIENWINDPNLHVYRPEEVSWMLQQKGDEANDRPITLPFVALSRETQIDIINPNRVPLSYEGLTVRLYDNDTNEEVHLKSAYKLNAIPVRLSYQLDIYTKGMAEADEYLRNFIFNLINYPKVLITIPYNGVNLEHKSFIQVLSQVEDNSDIPQRLYPGQFTRFTIRFTIDDAYLFSVIDKRNLSIEGISLNVVTKDDKGEIIDSEIEVVSINS